MENKPYEPKHLKELSKEIEKKLQQKIEEKKNFSLLKKLKSYLSNK